MEIYFWRNEVMGFPPAFDIVSMHAPLVDGRREIPLLSTDALYVL